MSFLTTKRRRALVAVVLLLSLLLLSHGVEGKRVSHTRLNSHSLVPRAAKTWNNGNRFFGLKRAKGEMELQELRKRDMECRRVHEFTDKCRFVRENCRDEEVGFFDYLEFYYCTLGNAPAVAFSIMGAWLVMLFTTIGIAASDFFCINLSTIANILGMSESMAGVTFLAFGNGSPDVFSTFAAMKINSGSLAVGELIGAASFIAAVVAGSMAIVHPFKVGRKSFVRDVSFFIVAVLFGIFFLADGKIQMWECLVMVIFYVFYVCFVVVWHWVSQRRKRKRRKERHAREHYLAPEEEEHLLVDEDDEDGGVGSESERPLSSHDFGALERGAFDDEEDDAEEQEQAAYASFSSNMRIQRPRMERSMTPATPHNIRPSLVGALEFRAVLHHLEKNKNLAGRPIHLRRYSDDPFLSVSTSTHSAPGSLINAPISSIQPHHARDTGRLRAVSVNDAAQAAADWGAYQSAHPTPPLPDVTISSPKSPRPTHLLIETTPISTRTPSPDLLALPTPHGRPNAARPSPTASEPTTPLITASSPTLLVPTSPGTGSETSSLRVFESPRPTSRSASPPGSIRLPPASLDSMSLAGLSGTGQPQWRHVEWWPYEYLPPPQLLYATLFPTLRGFREKTWLEKCLAVVAMLPVLLLTITLPVVEAENIDGDEKNDTPIVVLEPESPTTPIATDTVSGVGPKTWNRWLVSLQCLTAPVFLVIMFAWDDDPDTSLTKPILYAMIVGLVCLAGLLVITQPEKAPRGRYLLCFAGFAVSIGWISAIANEVVGVLKAFGVVLGISDAILGLTIFAVGNSLGDLVADITVARLGFPVMALSACFGGPMLNILLGIGISGLYITLSRADHEAYRIEVSSTLVISAGTLLLTLILLLVAVPLNGWYMSRRIGWTLIALWAVSTVVNLVVEVSGVGSNWGGGSIRGV